MIEEQGYAQKPKSAYYRWTLNFIFVLPILIFLAFHFYEYMLARNLREFIEQSSPHTQNHIGSISYDLFENTYSLNDLQFIDEKAQIALNIENIEIQAQAKAGMTDSAFAYQSLQLENLEYINPNIGLFTLAHYREKARKSGNAFLPQLFTLLFAQNKELSLPASFSLLQVNELEAGQIAFDYHLGLGKGKFKLESFSLLPFSQNNQAYYKIDTKHFHVQHRDFIKYNAHELSFEEFSYANLQAVDLQNFFSFFTKSVQSQPKARNVFNEQEIKQEIKAKKVLYFIDNELTLDFESLHSLSSVPLIFGNKTSIKNFKITQVFYDFYKSKLDFYLSDSQKKIHKENFVFEPLYVDLDFDYTLAPSMKQIYMTLSLNNPSFFSSSLLLDFILPQDVYSMLSNPDYFFGIILTEADFSFKDSGIINKYIDSQMKKHSLSASQARQYLFDTMPSTQFHTELKKLFTQKGRLAINLKSGKVLGISDVYGLLLYPMSNDFEVSYSPQ